MSFKITDLYIYPIKSLGRIDLQAATLTPKGLQYDRRWLLTDANGQFITQRDIPELVFFKTALAEKEGKKGIVVTHKDAANCIFLPARNATENDRKMKVTIWNDEVEAVVESKEVNDWFSRLLDFEVNLVFLPDADRQRKVGSGHSDAAINFPDAAPYLFLGQSALDHLNVKLTDSIPSNRFRANVIFEGGEPHIEDSWQSFKIGNAEFEAIKPCGRCQVTTTDQETGERGKEPLRTLTTYRRQGNRIAFGHYFKLKGKETFEVSVGDLIEVA